MQQSNLTWATIRFMRGSLPAKLQRAGALQDAPRFWGIVAPRAASWTAVVLHRFPGDTPSMPASMTAIKYDGCGQGNKKPLSVSRKGRAVLNQIRTCK